MKSKFKSNKEREDLILDKGDWSEKDWVVIERVLVPYKVHSERVVIKAPYTVENYLEEEC